MFLAVKSGLETVQTLQFYYFQIVIVIFGDHLHLIFFRACEERRFCTIYSGNCFKSICY